MKEALSTFSVSVDSNVYSLITCKKSCYALMNYFSCEIRLEATDIIMLLTPNDACNVSEEELRLLLLDELLDYSLREKISEQTDDVRTLILSNAFSNTKMVG